MAMERKQPVVVRYRAPDGSICTAKNGLTVRQLNDELKKQGISLTGKNTLGILETRRLQ